MKKLVQPLYGRGHVVIMNNFITSINFFMDLCNNKVYATDTIRSNCIGISKILKGKKTNKKLPQGSLLWAMYDSHRICAVTWMDKQLVTMTSTHAKLIAGEGEIVLYPGEWVWSKWIYLLFWYIWNTLNICVILMWRTNSAGVLVLSEVP